MHDEKPYKIQKKSGNYVLVLSTTYENPLSSVKILEDDLRAMNFSGIVLFDLLLCNGNEYNRFVQFDFGQGKLNRESRNSIDIEEIDSSTLEASRKFYKSNHLLLERNSVLLDEEKHELICS